MGLAGLYKKGGKRGIIGTIFGKILLSSQGFPILLTFTVLGLLFVLFRMKAIEMDYKMTNLKKNIQKVVLENKELQAKKAKLLSVKNLRLLAKKYNLNQPKQEQIIIIP